MRIPFVDPRVLVGPQSVEDLLRNYSSPFCVSPRDYHVHDADTLFVRGPYDAERRRPTAFSLRLKSVNAPEKPRTSLNSMIMSLSGMDAHWASDGAIAAREATDMAKGRSLLVLPRGIDMANAGQGRVNRILCDVYLSGDMNPKGFATEGCMSFEHELVRARLVAWRPGEEKPHPVLSADVIRMSRFENREEAMRDFHG